MQPNAGAHLLPEAAATEERRLEAVRCSAWFGALLPNSPWTPVRPGPFQALIGKPEWPRAGNGWPEIPRSRVPHLVLPGNTG